MGSKGKEAKDRRASKNSIVEPMVWEEPEPSSECCKPVPHAHFVRGDLASVSFHHVGKRCVGTHDPMPLRDWWEAVAARDVGSLIREHGR